MSKNGNQERPKPTQPPATPPASGKPEAWPLESVAKGGGSTQKKLEQIARRADHKDHVQKVT